MGYINDIQKAILELEGGAYQKLVDEYLYKKYKFNNIQPLGVQTGTNKVTKGIPDTYVHTDNGKYILICYGSVKEQAADKIKKDILSCFDKSKLDLEKDKIEKIICCFTSTNIHVEQYEEIRTLIDGIEIELISLGTLSHDLALYYPNIAKEYLNISVDTNQIFDIEDFVKAYDANGINSPINTTFLFRNNEMNELKSVIAENKITIVTGASGIGKTRLALEVCRKFEDEGWKVLCIKSHGELLYDDLKRYMDSPDKYLLFMDDANNIVSFEYVLELIFSIEQIKEVKVLLTIRDYAKHVVLNHVNKYSPIKECCIGTIKEDEIREILKENYGIINHVFLDRITAVAKGNIRLAILAGIRSVESGYSAITNAEGIFKNYYNPIIDNLDLNKTDILLLCILELIGTIRNGKSELFDKLKNEYLNGVDENDVFEKLYELELIDWFKREIAKISDQSFGNYILYYVLFEKRWLQLDELIKRMFLTNRHRIVTLLGMLYNVFYSEDMVAFIKEGVNKAWESVDESLQKDYMVAFYPLNPTKGMVYLKQYVEKVNKVEFDLREFDIESKKNHNTITTTEIMILVGYKRTKCYEMALELFLNLYEKRPDLFMDFYFAIVNNLLFDKKSYEFNYESEIKLINQLWARCDDGNNYNFTILFLHVAEKAFKIEFDVTEKGNDGNINFTRMHAVFCDEIKEFRCHLFSSMFALYSNPEYKEMVSSVLGRIFYDESAGKDIQKYLCFDSESVCDFFSAKENIEIDDALIMLHYKENMIRMEVELGNSFDRMEECYEYTIYKMLTKEYCEKITPEKNDEMRRDRISNIISSYQMQDYDRMFKTCVLFEEKFSDQQWKIGRGLDIIFSLHEKNQEQYFAIVELYLNNGAPISFCHHKIVDHLIVEYGYDRTVSLIKRIEFRYKEQWCAYVWEALSERSITKEIAEEYRDFQIVQLEKEPPVILTLSSMKKYLKFDFEILLKVSNYLILNPKYISYFFEHAYKEDTISLIKEIYSKNMEVLRKMYFSCTDKLFDYNGELFYVMYKDSENDVWKEYIKKLLDKPHFYERNNSIFEKIWQEQSYDERIEYAFDNLLDDFNFTVEDFARIVFANGDGFLTEKKKKPWILKKIQKEKDNISIINKLIEISAIVYPLWKNKAILCFLKYNKSIEAFKKIYCFATLDSWVGSEIPLIDKKIESLEELNYEIEGIDYIEHKDNIQERINLLKKNRREVELREYALNDRYMW